jgi:Na+-translocating ferredoxin:NAD+ oxidoreductase RnfD subunit
MALPARPSFSPQSSERLLHSGMTVGRYFGMHFLGALFPLTAGLMLYGWRAAAVVGAVVLSALAAAGLWRNIGPRGRQIHFAHVLWLALLLAMMLPAHLATAVPLVRRDAAWPPWPLLIAAGVTLVTVLWLLGGSGAIYVHPVLVTYLLLFIGFRQDLTPNWVLGRDHLVAGDVLLAPGEIPANVSPDPWLRRAAEPKHNALRADPPALWLTDYTTGRLRPERGQMPLHELLRDRMPPLEDLIVGGQPAPIGVGSGIAVIIGGLFLLYRGLIDFRIPLLAPLFAFVALLVLPVPTVVRDTGAHWRWLVLREPDVRWDTAVTFVNYEMMAGPLLFVSFFLATSPSLRPLSRRSRAIYAATLGVLSAVAQLYIGVSIGPYVALMLTSLLSPLLDRCFRPRPLV